MRRMITDKLTKSIKEVVNAYNEGEIGTVVANPTMTGTEANLTGLQVGDIKYAVPQGGGSATLYRHHVVIDLQNSSYAPLGSIIVDIISSDKTTITTLDAIKTILNSGTDGATKQIIAQGVWKDNDTWRTIVGLRASIGANELKGLYWDTTNQYVLAAVVSLTPGTDDTMYIADTIYTL